MKPKFAIIVFLVAAVVISLAACTSKPDGVEPVTGFDASRYVGTWYEIMRLDHRFERGLTDVTATYGLRADGSVSVVNRGLDPESCEWDSVEGYAEFIETSDIGSLAVTFFWPIKGGYHIFELDRRNYQWAAVSGPTKNYLWILARLPSLPDSVKESLIGRAGDLGFPTEELIEVDHGETDCAPAS